jgi:hypothetical protein
MYKGSELPYTGISGGAGEVVWEDGGACFSLEKNRFVGNCPSSHVPFIPSQNEWPRKLSNLSLLCAEVSGRLFKLLFFWFHHFFFVPYAGAN